jgi:predicted nucleic acid-binding Zn ribbon protein
LRFMKTKSNLCRCSEFLIRSQRGEKTDDCDMYVLMRLISVAIWLQQL